MPFFPPSYSLRKFNLLRESSEGYSLLLVLLHSEENLGPGKDPATGSDIERALFLPFPRLAAAAPGPPLRARRRIRLQAIAAVRRRTPYPRRYQTAALLEICTSI